MRKANLIPVIAALAAVPLLAAGTSYAFAQTAVSSCQTISTAGNYVLTGDLRSTSINPTGACLTIMANNVAIDFAT
jgi:hypothetical protein